MGFISYHGEKEDRYSEVLEYSRAQQNEEWKKTEDERVGRWLAEFVGDSSYIKYNLQDLLKLIISLYRGVSEDYSTIVQNGNVPENCDSSCLWKDFSLDLVDRHIKSYHVAPETRQKHLQTFIDRIFKLTGSISAEQHIEYMSARTDYRKYFTECFDPTWTGRYFYHLLQYTGKANDSNVERFFENYKKLLLTLGIYFYQAFRPRDNGWIGQLEADINALKEIREQHRKKEHLVLNPLMLENPLYRKEEAADEPQCTAEVQPEEPEINDAGFNRKQFLELVEKRGIPNYVAACKMLLECDLQEEILDNYSSLVDRMPVLQESIDKFDNIYHVDMDQFDEYFAPEALKVTATLVEYEAVKPSEEILQQTRENVLQATKKLLLVVNEKIDEIYKFVTIETNAEARALEALISQNGYVDPELKLK